MANYVPDGGSEAYVIQAPTLKVTSSGGTQTSVSTASVVAYQAPAAAADVAALKTQFDALLAKLVAAGVMASS